MKSLYLKLFVISIILFGTLNKQATACSAKYNHTNACVGDTVWFYGLDLLSVHAWDFGDSTFGKANLAFNDTTFHVYTKPGTYYVTHFVNIGAEWNYETQAITIGTNCFKAAFNAQCGGSPFYNFINQSIGEHLTCSWNFGESSSGIEDTSSAFAPSHQYASYGNYTITLIISDGSKMDTAYQTIQVDTTCMTANTSYMINPCYTDSAHYYYGFGGVKSVYWNFGDAASGAANNSTLFNPAHKFSAPGIYVGWVAYSNGTDTDTLPVYTKVIDCSVFPGDANGDGMVSGEDIFPIGLYFGDTGAIRANALLDFTSQACHEWGSIGMYLQALVNEKHADCNGDGVINTADLQAITQNFGKIAAPHNNQSEMQLARTSAPHLTIDFSSNTLGGYDAQSAVLNLGNTNSPAQGIYGFCVNIEYDPALVVGNSVNIDFSHSWLDTTGNTNLLTFYHNDSIKGIITIAATRTNHYAKGGYGELATINFRFKIQPGGTNPFSLNIRADAKVMANSMFPSNGAFGNIQNYQNVNIDNASVNVLWEGINEIAPENSIHVYPSPASEAVNIRSDKNFLQATVSVYDAIGRLISTNKMNGSRTSINVQSLPEGIYMLEIADGITLYHQSFVVNKN